MMIDRKQALKIARDYIKEPPESKENNLVIDTEYIIEEDFGWIFFFQAKYYLETGKICTDRNSANYVAFVVGNTPLIVDKEDGCIYDTGCGMGPIGKPLKYYVKEFRYYKKYKQKLPTTRFMKFLRLMPTFFDGGDIITVRKLGLNYPVPQHPMTKFLRYWRKFFNL